MISGLSTFCEQNQLHSMALSQNYVVLIKHAWQSTHVAHVSRLRQKYQVCCMHIKFNTLQSLQSVSELNEVTLMETLHAHFCSVDMMNVD